MEHGECGTGGAPGASLSELSRRKLGGLEQQAMRREVRVADRCRAERRMKRIPPIGGAGRRVRRTEAGALTGSVHGEVACGILPAQARSRGRQVGRKGRGCFKGGIVGSRLRILRDVRGGCGRGTPCEGCGSLDGRQAGQKSRLEDEKRKKNGHGCRCSREASSCRHSSYSGMHLVFHPPALRNGPTNGHRRIIARSGPRGERRGSERFRQTNGRLDGSCAAASRSRSRRVRSARSPLPPTRSCP